MQLPGEVMHTDAYRTVLQDYCGMLHAEGAFAGLSWPDAKQVAAAASFDARTRDDAAEVLRNRARNALAGADDMPWLDRETGCPRSAYRSNGAGRMTGLMFGQTAAKLGVDVQQVRRWVRHEDAPAIVDERRKRIPTAWVGEQLDLMAAQ